MSLSVNSNQSNDIANLIESMSEIQVLQSDAQGCDGAGGISMRLKDDGTSGCASISSTIRGQLDSRSNIILVPVSSTGRGVIFDLLYADSGGSKIRWNSSRRWKAET